MPNKYEQHSKHAQAAEELRRKMDGAAVSCLRKKRHATEQDAVEWASKYEGEFRAYHCRLCYQWHLARKRR